MLYRIMRNGQMYGPYTKEDLQRYLASGNVLPTDLAKTDEMTDWVPVSQILATEPSAGSYAAPGYTAPAAQFAPVAQPYVSSSAPVQAGAYPDPPNLSWVLLLVFGILTCGIFTLVYEFIQASYVKKIVPASKALFYLIALVVLQFINAGGSTARIMMMSQGIYTHNLRHTPSVFGSMVSFVVAMAVLVLFILYRFTMRGDLLAHFNGPEPIGLQLGPIMTFFFGGLYFQYHFNNINAIKQAARYGAPRSY